MIVIVRNFGQLGNRLWLSAHLIAAAREYGVTLVNPSFAEYAQHFPATAGDLWCRYPVVDRAGDPPSARLRRAVYKAVYLGGKSLLYAQRLGCPVRLIRLRQEESCDLASDKFRCWAQSAIPLLVSGWKFRSDRLLDKHADAVRAHFEILPRHRAHISSLIRAARRQADVLVGVHIRHGDYARFANGRYFYTLQQYVGAMRRITDQLAGRKVAFLVCGNATLERASFGDLNVHFGTNHLIEDMYAFAETDLIVGPPSTFSEWASFYGRVPLQFLQTAETELDLAGIAPLSSPRQAA